MSASNNDRVKLWFDTLKPAAQGRIRLFCFPYAGGSTLTYRPWAELLPHNIELYALKLPGRGNRHGEQPFSNLDSLVSIIADVLPPLLDKPFAFFGHSMGGLIAFELVRQLRRQQSRLPSYLFVSGRSAPQLKDTKPQVFNLPDDEFIESIRQLNGTPEEVFQNSELLHLMLPLLRADFELAQTYSYQAELPLDCPITAFGGSEDSTVTLQRLEPWREHTASTFRLHILPGDHFFLQSNQVRLLRLISEELYQLIRNLPRG